MNYVHIIALLAIIQFIAFGMLVGQARGKYGIKAPAMTGNEYFERAVRVQRTRWSSWFVLYLPC